MSYFHNKPIIIIGAGGHAQVLLDTLLSMENNNILGFTENNPQLWGQKLLNFPILGGDEVLERYSPENILLVNGLGSIGSTNLRQKIFLQKKLLGYHFASVIHPSAIISSFIELGEGVQILAGAVVQTNCKIAENVIVNTRAILDHDCIIAAHSHIAPNAVLSGSVQLGMGVHIGTGACVIQGIKIGCESIIGAGAVVLSNVSAKTKVIGIPAREMKHA